MLKYVCELLGIEKSHTTTYHAAGNGATERVNKILKPCLAKYAALNSDDWDLFLPMMINAYNNSVHSSKKVSPFEAVTGRPPVQISDIILNKNLTSCPKIKDISDYVKALKLSAEHVSAIINENIAISRENQSKNHDKNVKATETFEKGDLVKTNKIKTVGLGLKFEGPFQVAKKLSPQNYSTFQKKRQ